MRIHFLSLLTPASFVNAAIFLLLFLQFSCLSLLFFIIKANFEFYKPLLLGFNFDIDHIQAGLVSMRDTLVALSTQASSNIAYHAVEKNILAIFF